MFPHFVSNSIWSHSTLPWQCILSNSLFPMQTMWNEDNVSALDHVENFSKYDDQFWFWYFYLIYFWTTNFDIYLPFKVLHSTKTSHNYFCFETPFSRNQPNFHISSCKIWAEWPRLLANIGKLSNLALLLQILHFVFVSGIFRICSLPGCEFEFEYDSTIWRQRRGQDSCWWLQTTTGWHK